MEGDESTIDFDYDAFRGGDIQGAELLGYTLSGPDGSLLRRVALGNHAAFGSPSLITEIGRTGTRRRTAYVYDAKGLVLSTTKQVNAAGRQISDAISYNACGLPLSAVDTGGRRISIRYDPACRRVFASFEGGVQRQAYDGFGRLLRTAKDNGVSPEEISFNRYDDSGSAIRPRKVSVRGDLAEFVYSDEWGRPLAEKRCRLADPDGAPAAASLAALGCDEAGAIWNTRLWARDGSLRFRSGPFRRGEVPTFEWTFYDERRRLVRRVLPNHAYSGVENVAGVALGGSPGTVEFVTEYDVGVNRTTEPGGRVCAEFYGTLSKRRECAGIERGSSRFDAVGNIVSTTNAEGIQTVFAYDDFFRVESETTLTRLETCDGPVTDPTARYDYNHLDQIVAKSLPNGTRFLWERDDLGRLVAAVAEPSEGPDGERTRLVLNRWEYVDGAPQGTELAPAGRAIVEIDPNGNRAMRFLDGFGVTFATQTPDGRMATMQRDAMGRVTRSTDVDGMTTQYVFDSFGHLEREFLALSVGDSENCTMSNADAAGVCRVGPTNSFDGAGRLSSSMDADGVVTTYGYTASGNLAFTKQGDWLTAGYRYDERGNADLVWEDGAVTRFTYDEFDRIVSECDGVHGNNACGQTLDYTFDAGDRIASVTAGGISTTSFLYDVLGRLVERVNPDGSRRSMSYGAVTPMCELVDEDGITTTWTHDALGRLSEVLQPGRSEPRRFTYEFAVDGRSMGFPLPLAEVTVAESDGGLWTTWYDFAQRPAAERRPDGTVLRYRYDGARVERVELQDGARRPIEVMAFGYDALGRRAWDWGPVSPETFADRAGTPADGDTVQRFAYTTAGRLARIDGPVDPDRGEVLSSSRYTYDSDGLLTDAERAGVTSTHYAYDVARRYPRLAETAVGSAGAGLRRTRYAYDPSGLYLQSSITTGPRSGAPIATSQTLATRYGAFDAFGRPGLIETLDETAAPRALSSYTIGSDASGRIEKITVALDGAPLGTAHYAYRPNGQIASAFTDWAGGLAFERLPDGRVSAVLGLDERGNTKAAIATFSAWDALARPAAAQLAEGAVAEFDYDLMGRLVEQRVTAPDGESRLISNRYDSRGLLREERQQSGGATHLNLFDYTQEGWISREQRRVDDVTVAAFTYAYDSAGNRLERRQSDGQVERFRYGAVIGDGATGSVLLGVMQGSEWVDLEWDRYGGMIRDHRGYRVERDVLGRADKIWDASGFAVLSFLRDHTGRPVRITSPAGTRTHFWGNPTSTVFPLASVDESGAASTNAAFEQLLFGRRVDGRSEALVTDVRGNLVLSGKELLDLADAYGAGVARPANGFAFVFAGQEMLEQAPYFSAQQRLYDPDLGLFASADPVAQPNAWHLFRYADNNPVGRIDPWGTEDDDVSQLAGADQSAAEVAVGSDEALVIRLPGGEPTSGWNINDDFITHVPTNQTYPIDDIDRSLWGTTSGQEVVGTTVWFHDADGVGHAVTMFADGPRGPSGDQVTGGMPIDNSGAVAAGASEGGDDSAVTSLETDLTGGDSDTDPSPASETPDRGGSDGGSLDGSLSERLLHNYVGTRDGLDQLLADGYQIDFDSGLLLTPGGGIVIQGWNDALNPLPHKVAINMVADAVDDVFFLGGGPALQAAGVWGGSGSPANDLIKSYGFGYTPSEAPREAIAEFSLGIVAGAIAAPASAAATAKASSVLARGCDGPLRYLPQAVRTITGVACFVGDTVVATANGPVRIDEIRLGDRVQCQDDVSRMSKMCEVSRIYETENRAILDLTVMGVDGHQEVIGVTPNHRFWNEAQGWIEAGDLKVGDALVDKNGAALSVAAIRERAEAAVTYNLEVDDFHTYFVGKSGVWVHNGGPAVCPANFSKALNLAEASTLLGRPTTGWNQITVGEMRDLAARGIISRTNLTSTLRGKSGSMRLELLDLGSDVVSQMGVDGGALVRIGDQIWAVPRSVARVGKNYHVGHFGEAFTNLVDQVDGSMPVSEFRSYHWMSGFLERAKENVSKGASITDLDLPH